MEINLSQSSESHECTSHADGDWIVYRCPLCIDWEMMQHSKTGRMIRSEIAQVSLVPHHGANFGKSNMKALTLVKNEN